MYPIKKRSDMQIHNTNYIAPTRRQHIPRQAISHITRIHWVFLQHPFCMIQNYYKIFFHFFCQTIFFSFLEVNLKKVIHGSHIHVSHTCLFKALVFLTCEKNIIIYSQMRFQLYQSHRLKAFGLQSGKKAINWVSVGNLESLR